MKLLLDTQIIIWFFENNRLLSEEIKMSINNKNNKVYLSIISLWEIAIKISLDKLKIPIKFSEFHDYLLKYNFIILPVKFEHLTIVKNLPFHHRYSFDRLIIATSLYEKFPIISSDETFDSYNIKEFGNN